MDAHHRIRDLFDAAIDLPKADRSAFLREQCGRERTVYAEVARLLQAYEDGVEGADVRGDAGSPVGQLIGYGAYEILRELGQGGMGAVYLARRADGAFDRQVAVKVVRPDRVAATALERFARERRLLARIVHPSIATLYDAGATEDGLPYFVMEYVDGLPLTEYCDRKRLDAHARVTLFIQVCDAVACAHRAPIVHCDLKPANILVTAEARPVVLDFGIATALTRGGQEEEAPLDPYGSPRYASPEQLRGEPLQTTSDLYSLGVVLHEMLVGQVPATGPARMNAADAVLPSALLAVDDETTAARVEGPEEIAARRSTTVAALAAELRGDLDAIVTKCLQPAPERRYPTVDALREDLQRWLDGRPVAARPATAGYVVARFVTRHRWLVAASAAAIVILSASTVLVFLQWRSAESARRMAERRFSDVRGLATSLFDVDAALAELTGATAIRQVIVQHTSQYLDRLARDAGDDPALALELAESYRRVGDILGNPNGPNLGQRDGALRRYETARRHLARAAALQPDAPAVALAEIRVAASSGDVLLAQRRLDDARKVYEHGAGIVQAQLKENSDDETLRRTLAGIYRPLGQVHLAAANPEEALKFFEKARALDLAALTRAPADAEAQRLLALSQVRVADALAALDRNVEAIDTYQEASRLLGELSIRDPAKARLARDVAIGRMKLGSLVDADADPRGLSELAQALVTFRQLARLDQHNAGAQRDVLVALVSYGDAIAKSDAARSRASYLEAQRIAEALQAEPFDDPQAERDLRIIRDRLARAPAGVATAPELKLAIVRNGAEAPLDKHAPTPAIGDDVRLSWRAPQGQTHYVLVLGGEGRASLLSRDEVAAAGWRLKASGPPPSQTLLLISTSRSLGDDERRALVDRISRIPGPRRIPPDSHILWRTRQPELLDSAVTARGRDELEWPALVRAELERVPDLRFSGRTFPITSR